jgi:serine/threonine protein kinase
MTAPVHSHPSADELRLFGSGQMSADEAIVIESHVGTCADCCRTLKSFADDPLVELLRSASRTHQPAVASGATAPFLPETPLPPIPGAEELPPALRDHPRYRVLELLGHGKMGPVYRAEHRLMERTVALKLIDRERMASLELVERFRRETRAGALLSHPNIVKAFDAEQAGDTHFLVMEFVPGVNLAHLVAERGPLPVGEACEYIRQAALGLQYAHEQGMVHRDVKPHNLMRTPEGVIKILDFGLARFVSEQRTGSGSSTETADHAAPELAGDPRRVDIRADIYSLGSTLYQLLTGRVPFPGSGVMGKVLAHAAAQSVALSELRPDLPPGLQAVVAKMMARLPEDRYQTPAEVADALAPFAAVPPHVPRSSQAEGSMPGRSSAQRETWQRRWWIAAALLGWLTVGVVVAVFRLPTDRGKVPVQTEDRLSVPGLKPGPIVADDDFQHPEKSQFTATKADDPGRTRFEFAGGRYVMRFGAGGPSWLGWAPPPPPQLTNLVCQVVGRVTGREEGTWGIFLSGAESRSLVVKVRGDGAVEVGPSSWAKDFAPRLGPLAPPDEFRAGEFNTLAVVLRGRELTVFLNGQPMSRPLLLDPDLGGITACGLIGFENGPASVRIEFQRYTVWRLDP